MTDSMFVVTIVILCNETKNTVMHLRIFQSLYSWKIININKITKKKLEVVTFF